MQVEMRPIDSIRPYDRNPRTNDPGVEAVAQSIREFGFRQPIVVDEDGVIVVGHTRHKAAKKLGLTDVPVHVAVGLTPEQIKAYRIADNQTATLTTWDNDLLVQELLALQTADFDLGLTGFSGDDLLRLLGNEATDGLVDPDAVPEPPDEAITQPGDLWLLGEHRLLCGDSSTPEDVDRLLDGAVIDMINTDPPYNVNVEPRSNNAIDAGFSSFERERNSAAKGSGKRKLRAKDRPVANDAHSVENYERLLRAWVGNLARALKPGGAAYLWGGYANCANYPPVLKACGLHFSQAIIWVKEAPVLNRKDFMGNHEWCFYSWREGAAHTFLGPNNVTDVWSIKKVSSQKMVHLTEKPVELAARAMEYSSRPGERVLDLFGGSGSTLIAAEQLKRRAYLMELDPLYCDIIVARYEQFTGQKAERQPAPMSGKNPPANDRKTAGAKSVAIPESVTV
jgi:DNA modification methylase